ncbi:MAG: 30S ribosomal protein S27e [Thermoprotei archaeon]|nr:MAG: 30S ribosomal protein S27e [Thermoprotei archaeon]RLF13398.1 MAG: 30S ribosomal protein S27e [Thermoprotei archaeon]
MKFTGKSKFRELIPQPKSRFLQVRCPECGNVQMIFSHASTLVKCLVCGRVLAYPTGGKARIEARILKTI